MKGWTRGFDLLEKSIIFFPIHENSHWYLLILNKNKKSFEILDPYEPMSKIVLTKKYQKQREDTKIKKIKEVEIKQKEKVSYILNNYIFKLDVSSDIKTYEIICRKDIPKQENDWDCGVFMLMFIKYTAINRKFDFETSHMQFFRTVIRKEIESKQIDMKPINLREINSEESFTGSNSSTYQSSVEEDLYESKKNENRSTEPQDILRRTEQSPPMFVNRCGTICWLNSIVQLLLITIDEDINSPLKEIFKNFKIGMKYHSTQTIRSFLSNYMPELKNGHKTHLIFLWL